MNRRSFLILATLALLAVATLFVTRSGENAYAGEVPGARGYTVLAPITHDNLTIYPVVAASAHDSAPVLTLDEGIASGQVTVGEAGSVQPLLRGPHPRPVPQSYGDVNRLVLVNNSDRPLLLLAGEIVTGGKQDRVIGSDRIVPAHGDPVDLSVFCVEPGRWTGQSKFGGTAIQMAQPSVRKEAMADKNQQEVWNKVAESRSAMAAGIAAAPAPNADTVEVQAQAQAVEATSSYARVMDNKAVQTKVDSVAKPVQRSYDSVIRELRSRNAVGVVVAINGRIVWADIFSGTSLLEKYWPKLVRSYAAEAVTSGSAWGKPPSVAEAQAFIDDLSGSHQVVEIEPGVYRHTEITGDDFKAFQLTSLLPKTGYDVHISKMAD